MYLRTVFTSPAFQIEPHTLKLKLLFSSVLFCSDNIPWTEELWLNLFSKELHFCCEPNLQSITLRFFWHEFEIISGEHITLFLGKLWLVSITEVWFQSQYVNNNKIKHFMILFQLHNVILSFMLDYVVKLSLGTVWRLLRGGRGLNFRF